MFLMFKNYEGYTKTKEKIKFQCTRYMYFMQRNKELLMCEEGVTLQVASLKLSRCRGGADELGEG